MPQNKRRTATTIIKRFPVVLFDEIRNLRAKPKITPMTKQIIILSNGQAISAKPNALPSATPTKMEIEIVYRTKAITPSMANTSKDVFVFRGRGWGHAVGMSQNGAKGMAEEGFTAEEIIKWYYSGVTIKG
jgi:SpoIID/LytB domain protein